MNTHAHAVVNLAVLGRMARGVLGLVGISDLAVGAALFVGWRW